MAQRNDRTTDSILRKAGVRSGLEDQLKRQIVAADVPYEYEGITIPYLQPAKPRKYTPDFVLLNNGIVVESKGRFVTADRQKHLLIQAQYPDLDLRIVFSYSRSKISKQSKTTYALWCATNGIPYADRYIPSAWFKEPPNERSLAAIREIILRSKEKKRK